MRGEANEALDRAFKNYRAEIGPLLDAREAVAAVAVEGEPPSKELHQIRLGIRNVNDNAIVAFANTLPAALVDGFRREALAKSYPTAYVPSYPLELLRKLAAEFPEGSLRDLVADADNRFATVCDRAVSAIRLRDDARVADEDTRVRADRAIQDSEKGYESLDTWVCTSVQKVLTEQQLNASETGRDLLAFVRNLEGGALMAWDEIDSKGRGSATEQAPEHAVAGLLVLHEELEFARVEVDAAAGGALVDHHVLELLLSHLAAALRAAHPVGSLRRGTRACLALGIELGAHLRERLLLLLLEGCLFLTVAG